MSKNKIRGLTAEQELNEEFLLRDTRSVFKKISDGLSNPGTMAGTLFGMGGAAMMLPALSDLIFIAALFLWRWARKREESAPLKMPIQSGTLDPNQLHPGTGKPTPGQGIFYLGSEMKTGKEIWLTNDDARQHFLVVGTTGAGKAQPLDALVHTPAGFVAMGDIRVGDLVSTPDGAMASVKAIYPQGEIDIYRVTFDDGRSTEACGDHLWEIHHKHWNGKYKKGVSRAGTAKPRVLSTLDVAALLESNKGSFSVRLPEPVEKPQQVLPIHPYVMGALIGDGNYANGIVRFSTQDSHILDKMQSLAPAGNELVQYESTQRAYDYNYRLTERFSRELTPIKSLLKDLDVMGQGSATKRIPQCYLEGSVAQRWELLAGLMDTDGTVGRNGEIYYSTSSEGLSQDFALLVRSLGGIAKIRQKQAWYRKADGTRKDGRTNYIVNIRLPEPRKAFSLPRKREATPEDYQYASRLRLKVVSIEKVGRKPAQCIYIDHPDHLYITDDYVVTHNTESLLGFAANALMWGSGFLFCDGKGDVALYAKVYALARRFGREDDLLVLNFMTGNQDLGAAGGRIMSNTLNPFSTGSSDSLTQMVVSLMDDAGGDGAMWKGRATAMLTGVMRALSWLRDEGQVDLNVGEIREFMSLRKIIDLGDVDKFPDMPQPIRKTIKSYLTSLPGFQPEKGYKQAQTTLDQHGYLEMQFTKILGSLADVYGHIFFTPSGEVDMFDVVLNRRILVIMLPALEKSGDEIANLGKIVVATLKGMMGATLGSSLEGSWTEVVENRVTNSPSPFICVLDEVGYYTVEGMALMAAQARSLGFTMVYASQDIPAMKRLNEKEAASIIANTNTKIFMRSEEAEVTGRLAIESGGQAMRAQVSGYEGHSGELGMGYRDNLNAQLEKTDRVNWLDLKAQSEGEMHIVFKERVVRAKGFYANPEGAVDRKKLVLRANHFIKVPKPDFDELERARRLPLITKALLSEENIAKLKADAAAALEAVDGGKDDISVAARIFRQMLSAQRKPVEAAAGAVGAIINDYRDAIEHFNDAVRRAAGAGVGDLDLDRAGGGQARGGVPGFGEPMEAPAARDRTLNTDIRHRVVVEGEDGDEDQAVDLAEDVGSNDSIMKALAALDFGQDATDDEVERRIDSAIDPRDFVGDDDLPDPSDLLTSDLEDAVHESSGDIFSELDGLDLGEKPEGPKAAAKPAADQGGKDAKDDGEEAPARPTNITTQLLSELILGDDDE